jgi:hypothetical protein
MKSFIKLRYFWWSLLFTLNITSLISFSFPRMIKQYIHYYSVGIDDSGKLCPLPVLCKVLSRDSENSRSHAQTTEEAAEERNLTILLIDDLYDLDDEGVSGDIRGPWYAPGGMVRASNLGAVNEAILEIRMRHNKVYSNGQYTD